MTPSLRLPGGEGNGTAFADKMASSHVYAPTFPRSVVDALWAFCDDCIGGVLIVVSYNLTARTESAKAG